MALLKEIIQYADQLLSVHDFQDYGPNGLQVEGKAEVTSLASSVSASLELFEKAKNSDLILVHHGIFWYGQNWIVQGSFKKRLECLLTNNISLVAYHLPLDAHEKGGNNARLADLLGLENRIPFARYKGKNIGCIGYLAEAMDIESFQKRISDIFSGKMMVYPFGKKKVQKIAIVSGRAPEQILNAVLENCDVYLSGEVAEPTLHIAKEEKIHFFSVGHYASEKLGIQFLGEQIAEKFQIAHSFLEIPNPV